ncbi:MAG: hypothetical protein P4M00_18980 [Azospirillaceae bacterium]|nr:hypothetical protein [Azospirillaceae bacterium]
MSVVHQRPLFLGLAVALLPLYGWLASLGYGTNTDSYAILRSWQVMVDSGLYQPSRGQGYFVPELAIGFLASLGGSAASNALSVLLALGALALGYDLLRRLNGTTALPATLVVMANPHWMIAGTTSLDYVYGAFFFVLGVRSLSRGAMGVATLAFAFAVGSRIVYGPLGFGALTMMALVSEPTARHRQWEYLALFCTASGLFYLPALVSAHVTLGFLTHSGPPNNYLMARIMRFLWKTPSLYGFVGFTLLLAALGPRLWHLARDREIWRRCPRGRQLAIVGALGVLLYNTMLFAYLPAEIGYQIPSLLAIATLLAATEVPVGWLAAVIASQLLLAVVRPDVLTVRAQQQQCMGATITLGADFDPGLKAGVLVDHVRDARSAACALRQLPHPVADPWTPLPDPDHAARTPLDRAGMRRDKAVRIRFLAPRSGTPWELADPGATE